MQAGAAVVYVSSTGNLLIQWSGFDLANAKAVLCLGSDATHCDVATLADVTLAAGQHAVTAGMLSQGAPVYATIRVSQDGKLTCARSTSVLRLDTTPPTHGLVNIGHNDGSPPYWANS
jgi:hypothetical protein